jgi:WD40 repeat protein
MKAVHCVEYSSGGAMLAASSGPLVIVYSAYTMEPLLTLSAHMGTVRQVAWSKDDLHLFTVGDDGERSAT